jgi:hypothetical protein
VSRQKVARNSGLLPPLPGADGAQGCGDFGIRIDRSGTWHYRNSPIGRKELVCLFASVLERRQDGSYWLVTPVEQGRIEVEDVPFIAVEIFLNGSGRDMVVSFRTNVDEMFCLDEDHKLRVEIDPHTGEPSPYVHVRDGLDARLARSVYYELVALGFEEKIGSKTVYGIWSKDLFFPLGNLDGSA